MTINIRYSEANLPVDPETNSLFKRILELCTSDSLNLYETADSSLNKRNTRKFAAGIWDIKTEKDTRYSRVHFSFRDVVDDEAPSKRSPCAPEVIREEYRDELRKAVAALEAMTPKARRARYEERVAAASQENKTKVLIKLVGGTARQKAYAELLRAKKIPMMPKGSEILERVKNAVDIIELATAYRKSDIQKILAKYGL